MRPTSSSPVRPETRRNHWAFLRFVVARERAADRSRTDRACIGLMCLTRHYPHVHDASSAAQPSLKRRRRLPGAPHRPGTFLTSVNWEEPVLGPVRTQASSDRECPMCLQRHLSNIFKYFLGYRSRTRTPNPNLKP